MSDSTNSTENPFGGELSDHGGLYKGIGLSLAVASGLFIGSSFVLKKKGLLESMDRSGSAAGEGYAYLRSSMWWTGMILMVVGECCNFVAYAFTAAILVTPLGALSVVVCAVLSSIFLKERLTFQGKMGCIQCILGAVVIVLHAPEEGADDSSIETFKSLMLSVGFLVYAGIAVVVSLVLAFYFGPRWGKRNMLVYIGICSWVGSLSVVFTQGLGSAIVHSITISNQFTNWFIYVVLGLTVITLVVEIIYLNKALNLFNTALVTPIYYVTFTTLTIISSIVLYRGFDASAVDIVTCVFGFLVICSGVALLHHTPNKSTMISDESGSVDSRSRGLLHMFEREKDLYEDEINEKQSLDLHSPGPTDLFPKPFTGIGRYTSSSRQSISITRRSGTFEEEGLRDDVETATNRPAGHRAQADLDPISARKLGLHMDKSDEEHKGLVDV